MFEGCRMGVLPDQAILDPLDSRHITQRETSECVSTYALWVAVTIIKGSNVYRNGFKL